MLSASRLAQTPTWAKRRPPKRRPPTKQRKDPLVRDYLTPEEVKAMVAAAKKAGGRMAYRDGLLILLAFRHGLRASELTAAHRDSSPTASTRRPSASATAEPARSGASCHCAFSKPSSCFKPPRPEPVLSVRLPKPPPWPERLLQSSFSPSPQPGDGAVPPGLAGPRGPIALRQRYGLSPDGGAA